MLMLPGPTKTEPARKPARNRRATDVGAPAAVARPAGAPRPGRRSTDPKPQPDAHHPQGGPDDARIGRPYAPLVAQLIAGKLGAEQTRVRRRGTPDDAVEAYGARRKPSRSRVIETEA